MAKVAFRVAVVSADEVAAVDHQDVASCHPRWEVGPVWIVRQGSACRLAAREADTVGVTVNLVREDY